MPQFEIELENGHKYQIDADTEEQAVNAAKGEERTTRAVAPEGELSEHTPTLMERVRQTGLGRQIFGPSTVEREAMIEKPVTPKVLLDTAFKFASPPPQIAEPIRTITAPVIEALPPVVGGLAEGVRETALNFPIGAGAVGMGKNIGRALMGLFTGEYVISLPEQATAFKQALDAGDRRQATSIATQAILMGGLLGAGAAHEIRRIRAPVLPASEAEVENAPGPPPEGLAPRLAQLKTPPDKITKPPKAGGVTPIDEYLAAQQKGVEDAVQERSTAPVPVEPAPGDSEALVQGVPPPGQTAQAQAEAPAPAPEVQPDVRVETPAPPASWLVQNAENLVKSLPKETLEKIQDLHAEGRTANQIAKELGMDSDVVREVRLGLRLPSITTGALGTGEINPEFTKWQQAWQKSREHTPSPTPPKAPEAAPPAEPTAPAAEKPKEPWQMTSITREDGGVYVVASKGGNESGSAIIKNLGDNVYELNEIKVNEVERGKGLGTKLYQQAADEIHKKGGKLYTSPELTTSGKGLVESLDKSGLLGDNARVKGAFRREIAPVKEGKRMETSRETPAPQSEIGSPSGTETPEQSTAQKPAAPPAEAASEKMEKTPTDPRLMSDQDIAKELDSITKSTDPLYDKLEKMGDAAFMPRSSKYTPEAQAIHDQITPFSRRKELLQFEKTRRENEIKNKAMFEARDKRVAEAPVYQRRNGWEIVKEGVDYVLRHPETKEDVYRGKLKRVREVADESKPEPQPPQEPLGPTQGAPAKSREQLIVEENARAIQALEEQLKSIQQQKREVRAKYKGVKRVSFMNRTTPNIERGQKFDAELGALEVEEEGVGKQLQKLKQEQSNLGPTQGAGPGTPSAAQGPDPKAQIKQLADAFKASKAPISERIKALVENSFNLGERLESAKDAVARALSGLKASGDALRKTLTSFTEPDAYSNALGYLSEALERRGWDTRMFVKAVKRAIPQTRRRNAIAKWVDAGGDRATLEEGLANTPDRYKQAYRDALNLSGDDLIHAQNIQAYFEARLKEAIDAGVVEHGLEDYIHRIYPKDTPIKRQMLAYVQSGILSKNPSLAKKRFFQYDWEAEQAGFNPVQDFLPRITDYETSLSKAIAAREFIAKMAQMKAPDGRPVVGIKGVGIPLTDAETGERTGTLIKPLGDLKKNADPADANNYRGDYVNREYNALSKWKWVAGDTEGKPILLKGDVAIHPAFVGRVDALLEPSKVRYGRYPRLGQTLLNISSGFKQTMLDLSGFHHVQIALHAMEHRVMPWAINKEIDFSNPKVEGLLRGGVTLGGDYHTQREGLVGSSLTRQIPVLGPIMESYHSYLFQDLIPRIKMTMALHALDRNRVRFAKDLASGKMSEKALYKLTADQANAAFGEQNYIMLERSKTSQDILRLSLLAPDFLEARGRFVGQALTKYGTEQRVALALGALTMWTLARLLNKALNDQWHNEPENLFSVVHKNNSYSLRTVQGDVLHLLERPVQFWMSRLNPVYGRTAMELATGRDWFGRKRSMPEQAWDAASNIVPISLRSSRERTMWESMLNAFGVTARRYNDVDDAFKLAQKWKAAHGVQERGEFIYDPDKDPLRALKIALVRQDEAGATKEIQRLLQSKATTIGKLNDYFNRYASMPFTGSRAHDRQWKATLSEDERKTVESGRQTKERIRKLYRLARNQYLAALITANSTP